MTGSALWKRRKLLSITWETTGRLLSDLADEIRGTGFQPDVIVGITRGGLPAAVTLSNLLDVLDFRVLGIPRNSSNSRYSERGQARFDHITPDRPLDGRRVLVVDDIMGDGGTMALALEILRERGAGEIRTAVVVRNVNAAGRPDHHCLDVDDWTVFPWEAPPALGEHFVEVGT